MKLYEILMSNDIVISINQNIDYLIELIPEIKNMIGFEHKHPHHHLDVWNHTLYALSKSPSNFEIRLCLLLHDIGKPFSYQEGEVRHFKNHPNVSAEIAYKALNKLNFDKELIDEICFLIKKHDTPIKEENIAENYDLYYKLYQIQYCDALAHHPKKIEPRKKYLSKTLKKFKKERI